MGSEDDGTIDFSWDSVINSGMGIFRRKGTTQQRSHTMGYWSIFTSHSISAVISDYATFQKRRGVFMSILRKVL